MAASTSRCLRTSSCSRSVPSKVDCGWRFELPEGWHLLALQKSRHAGEWIVEAPLIDHAYRGSVHAVLHYLGTDPITMPKGEYVMQLLPVYSPHMDIVEESVDQLTLRGDGAFGSTMET